MSARPLGARFVGSHDRSAEQNRAALNAAGVFAVNLIGPEGVGKAALVRRTVTALGRAARVGVVATTARRATHDAAISVEVESAGAPHLSPAMLARAIVDVREWTIDFLIIENVADFVCPATYRLGTHVNVRLTTVLEHDRRPRDQPQLFEGLDALVVNKMDRLGERPFDLQSFRQAVDTLNPNLVILPISCATGDGIDRWADWLMRRREAQFYAARRPAHAPSDDRDL